MANETKQGNDLCLPDDFFYADFLVDSHHALQQNPVTAGDPSPLVAGDFEDDCMAVLARKMASKSLNDNDEKSFQGFAQENKRQLSHEVLNRSVVEPLPMSPLRQMTINGARYSHLKNAEDVHFQKFRQHLGKQQTKGKAVSAPSKGRNVLLQDSRMRAVFLRDKTKESKGTGVFLPRGAGAKDQTHKKQGCSTVFVPERVVQALKLNLDESGELPRVSDGYALNCDALSGRSEVVQPTNASRQFHHHSSTAVASRDIRFSGLAKNSDRCKQAKERAF